MRRLSRITSVTRRRAEMAARVTNRKRPNGGIKEKKAAKMRGKKI